MWGGQANERKPYGMLSLLLHSLESGPGFDTLQGGETDLIQRIDSDVTNMNTISKSKSLIATPWKFKCPLTCPVQNNNVKTKIAQNDTDLSCLQLHINVSKCCAFVKHFETLISSLIQDKSVSF